MCFRKVARTSADIYTHILKMNQFESDNNITIFEDKKCISLITKAKQASELNQIQYYKASQGMDCATLKKKRTKC